MTYHIKLPFLQLRTAYTNEEMKSYAREAVRLYAEEVGWNETDAQRYCKIIAASERAFPVLSVCDDPENEPVHKYGRDQIDALIDRFDEIQPITRAQIIQPAERPNGTPDGYEHRSAIKEAARSDATEAYFKARHPSLDTIHNRRILEYGFDLGYDAAPTQSTQQPDAGEPVAWLHVAGKPGKRSTWASIEEKKDDQGENWKFYEVSPLYAAPVPAPQVAQTAEGEPDAGPSAEDLTQMDECCATCRRIANEYRVKAAAPQVVQTVEGGIEKAFSGEVIDRRDARQMSDRHSETPKLLALIGMDGCDSIPLYRIRIQLEGALAAPPHSPIADSGDDERAAELYAMARDDRTMFPASTVRMLWELKEQYRAAQPKADSGVGE